MHSLSASFILGYHGCDRETGERLLKNESFKPSTNDFDWLGSGIYFWEANPDRALDWAKEQIDRKGSAGVGMEPFVVGAAIDPGFCLDLISANGIQLAERSYVQLRRTLQVHDSHPMRSEDRAFPKNTGGDNFPLRRLDCAVINFLHRARQESRQPAFDTVRGVFTEGEHIYENSGFRRKTHIQICVRNPEKINGVFRVPERHFTR